MIIQFIFALVVIGYFSSMIAYTYDINRECDCQVKWYFDYLKYFGVVTLIIRVFTILYVIGLILSHNTTQIWENDTMKYLLLLFFIVNIAGNGVYIYALYKYNQIIENSNNDCQCYRGKFYDVMKVASYIYIGVFGLNAIIFLSTYVFDIRKRS